MTLIILIPILLVLGLITGILAGLFGIGGALVVVPAINMLLPYMGYSVDISMHVATATAFSFMIFTTGFSFYNHIKLDNINWTLFKQVSPFIFISSIIGITMSTHIKGRYLSLFFAVMLFIFAVNILLTKRPDNEDSPDPKNSTLAMSGLVLGFISSGIGVGVAALGSILFRYIGYPFRKILATNSGLNLAIAIPAVSINLYIAWQMHIGNHVSNLLHIPDHEIILPPYSFGYINLLFIMTMLPMTILTSKIGAKLNKRLPAPTLRKLFGFFLLFLSIKGFSSFFLGI